VIKLPLKPPKRHARHPGSLGAVKKPIAKIEPFSAHSNAGSTPFACVTTADEILASTAR
jgi:hypothetical protein